MLQERERWATERIILRGGVNRKNYGANTRKITEADGETCIPKAHYVTYATEVKEGLIDLLLSAKLSGVDVTVLLQMTKLHVVIH